MAATVDVDNLAGILNMFKIFTNAPHVCRPVVVAVSAAAFTFQNAYKMSIFGTMLFVT